MLTKSYFPIPFDRWYTENLPDIRREFSKDGLDKLRNSPEKFAALLYTLRVEHDQKRWTNYLQFVEDNYVV